MTVLASRAPARLLFSSLVVLAGLAGGRLIAIVLFCGILGSHFPILSYPKGHLVLLYKGNKKCKG
jgi:hypothetical protein